LQWSGFHVNDSSVPGLESDLSLVFDAPAYNYIDSFRVTIVGNASDGNISLSTLDNFVVACQPNRVYLTAATSGIRACVFTVRLSAADAYPTWTLDSIAFGNSDFGFRTVSQGEIASYEANLVADQTGWTTPPSDAAIQALAQRPGYQSAYQQLEGFGARTVRLFNVQTQSFACVPKLSGEIMTLSNRSDEIHESNFVLGWSYYLTDSNLTEVNFTNPNLNYSLILDVNRHSRMAGQMDSNDMFPFIRRAGVAPQPWYANVLDSGTSYNGTTLNWVKVVLQHPQWLGWYLGVCSDCVWGQQDPYFYALTLSTMAMMQTNETDPAVQWIMFQY